MAQAGVHAQQALVLVNHGDTNLQWYAGNIIQDDRQRFRRRGGGPEPNLLQGHWRMKKRMPGIAFSLI